MIDERFCCQCGTDKQHRLICFLASKADYSRLRDAVSDFLGCSVSRCQKEVVTVAKASQMIDWLKAKDSDTPKAS